MMRPVTIPTIGAIRSHDALRGHDLHGVTELLELPLPIECAGVRLDADEGRLQFAKELEQLFAADPACQCRASLAVDAVKLGRHLLPGRCRVRVLSLLISTLDRVVRHSCDR